MLTSIAIVCFAVILPILPVGSYFGFVPLPSWFYAALTVLVVSYLFIVQLAKWMFYKLERRSQREGNGLASP
jgi:Mg2+-importing ATPase